MTKTPERLLGFAVLAALAVSCGRDRATPAAGSPAEVPPAPRARLVDPQPVRYAVRIVATGTLEARQSSPLAMSVPGTLSRVAVRRGEEVRRGALLAALEDGAAAASVRQAEAAVAAARAQLALAEDALGRVRRIAEEEGASQAQLVEVGARRDLAAAQLDAAGAQLEQARVHHAHHFLRAPFAGVVTRVPDGIGIAVAPGVPLVSLVTTRELVLQTSLTQQEAAAIRTGSEVEVAVPATGARAKAKVSVVVPAVDPDTNRVPVEIEVPNADGRFLPSAAARAELSRAGERDAWRVPAAALVQRAGGYGVWAAGADGKARALPVTVLAEEGESAVVVPEKGGWPQGVRVVEAPPIGIAEGTLLAESSR